MPTQEFLDLRISGQNEYLQNLLVQITDLLCASTDLPYVQAATDSICKARKFMSREAIAEVVRRVV
jgi:hypothetical protein